MKQGEFIRVRAVHLICAVCLIVSTAGCASTESIVPVMGDQGMVVAGHPEAAEIGLSVLKSGGNAMDAAVAASFALGVAEPYGSGIGGKCVIVYFEAESGETWFFEGLDESGAELDVEAFVEAGSDARAEGALGVGVPGLVATMEAAHEKLGSRPWAELLEPSIRLARDGFTVVPGMKVFFERRIERIQSHPECARLYMPGGAVPEEGTRLPNPDLATTMEHIAAKGRQGFYEGRVAELIVNELQSKGSSLTLSDFKHYKAQVSKPLTADWEGYELMTATPPVSGGATVLLALKVLEGHSWPDSEPFRTANNIDHWGRAMRHVYPVIQDTIADVPEAMDSWEKLVDPEAVAQLRKAALKTDLAGISEQDGLEAAEPLASGPGGWTTHFVVADSKGNVASVTQSLSHHFGSGVIAPGTGVILNNSLNNFSTFNPEGVNYAAPQKRARSTIAPMIVLKDGRPVLAIGLPGGQRIPTTLIQVLIDHLQFGSGLGEAISSPRFHLLRSWSAEPDSDLFQMEKDTSLELSTHLREKGWQVEVSDDTEFFGGVTGLEISGEGKLTGWADYRRTNHAVGY
ncbi:gamma-glutamyltransferase [Puniceicoccales bacterium CK1056]|uniref:Glutathione hydrolase proenzyme n=1 Tax=Oceanipulchritudo coccoides TaxID=2706888 RepID=A0A6B2M0G2_9BACT|nr:gamma-glutamyltransferase [Oceanipulchritudo coccoides]NDV62203.1 gamma-glutamyltransferase [Oceanipulchritudo coccoides]